MAKGSSRLTSLLAIALLAACEGCPPDQLAQTYAIPAVTPQILDFGTVDVAQRTRQSITLRNTGQRDWEDLQIELMPESDPAFSIPPREELPFEVRPFEDVTIEVTVYPRVANSITGRIEIRGRNAEDDSIVYVVELRARAENRGLPDIEVTPFPTVDFGRIGAGDVKRMELTIRNAGIRDLIIDDIELDTFQGSPFGCAECAAFRAHVMRPQETATVRLTFNPPDVQDYQTSLRIFSNDPDETPVEVTVTGSGTQAPTCQVDILDDVSALQPQTTVRLDGSNSTSSVPGSYIARYEWDLYRPIGSTTVVESQGPGNPSGIQLAVDCPDPADPNETPCSTRVDVLADLAGSYVLTLVVQDSLGIRSAPCTADFRAIPKEQLHVQLVWDHPTADMDLHYQLGGGPPFQHSTDCYFSNRFPVWFGVESDDPRNPRLDVDDKSGFGPENVNVTTPSPGTYRISVHYWDRKTQGDAATLATVRVYVRGQLMLEQGNFFTSDQEMWHVAEIEWPASTELEPTINPLGEVVPYARPF